MAKPRPQGLVLRKHADRTAQNPDGSWRLAGVSLVEPAPQALVIGTGKVTEGKAEGWISTTGDEPVMRPAGPTMDDWNSSFNQQPHVFLHVDTITLHTLEGDVSYKVTHQPDKYVDDSEVDRRGRTVKENSHGPGVKMTPKYYEAGLTRVDNFYIAELVKG